MNLFICIMVIIVIKTQKLLFRILFLKGSCLIDLKHIQNVRLKSFFQTSSCILLRQPQWKYYQLGQSSKTNLVKIKNIPKDTTWEELDGIEKDYSKSIKSAGISLEFNRSILNEILYLFEQKNNDTDSIRRTSICNFLSKVCRYFFRESEDQISQTHFVFIVPTEWSLEMRDTFLPSLFEDADIIKPDGSQGCLTFFSVLEATVAALQCPSNAN